MTKLNTTRLNELPIKTILDDDDYVVISGRGTKKIKAKDITKDIEKKAADLEEKTTELGSQLDTIANKGTTIEVLERVTKEEIDRQMADGTIANLTIANESLSAIKTDFIDTNLNLLNNVSTIQGYYNPTTGVIEGKSSYKTTELLFLKHTLYYTNIKNNIAYFDINKNFIIGYWGGQYAKPVIPPPNAKYIAITFENSLNISEYWFKPRQVDNYIISDVKLEKCLKDISKNTTAENINTIVNEAESNFINISKVQGFHYTTNNLYNSNTNLAIGTYINPTNGNVVSNVSGYPNNRATDFIPVIGGNKYSSNIHLNYAFYDSNKNFISGAYGGWSNPVTAPSNAKYIRFTIDVTTSNIVFSEGDSVIDSQFSIDNFLKNGLNKKLSKLNNLKWNVLGDSITSIDYSKPTWWQIISSKYDMTVNCYGISGTTLAHTNDRHLWDYNWGKLDAATIGYDRYDSSTWATGNCFCERYVKMTNDADIITVMGSTNDNSVKLGTWDSTDTDTFYGALNILITGLINKYPDKIIAFFTPIQMSNSYLTNVANPSSELDKKLPADTLSLQLRAEAIKRKCNQYSIPCLDLFNCSGINGVGNRKALLYRNNDDTHPTSLGNEWLARNIEDFIINIV